MRHLIAICLLACPIAGCMHSGRESALRVWHSPDSTIEQRADAVSALVPVGASVQTVESVLGTNAGWTRFHGPTIDAYNRPSQEVPDHDDVYWGYSFSGGAVFLTFDPPTTDGGGFVRAVPCRLLFTVPIKTNAP